MRLTKEQIKAICETFKECFLAEEHIWLFGSRADISKKGGDIDLYIETNDQDLLKITERKLAFLAKLKKKIGDQKIDVIICPLKKGGHLPIYDEAKNTGIQIL